MRFALWGSGADALRIVRAIEDHEDHHIAGAVGAGGGASADRLPPLDWEALFDGAVCEAVVVGHGSEKEDRAEQLRQLVQAAIPMILVHPACEAILGYELDMIRRDTQCVLVPYSPGLLHPVIDCLRQLALQGAASSMGRVEQLVLERQLADRRKEHVLNQFARDVFLIRQILGTVSQLSASGPTVDQADYANLSIHLTGPGGVLARWSVAPATNLGRARLSLLASAGEATVELAEDESTWHWNIPTLADADLDVTSWDGPGRAVQLFALAVAGTEIRPTWDDACRATDLAEVVDISLRRRRTIDVYTQQCTEKDTFKGLMAVGGCAVLLFTMVAVVLVAVIESFDIGLLEHPIWQRYPWRLFYWRNWPFYLFGLLAVFLLLQLLRLVFPKSPDTASVGPEDDDRAGDQIP